MFEYTKQFLQHQIVRVAVALTTVFIAVKFFFAKRGRAILSEYPNKYLKFKLIKKETLTDGQFPVKLFRFELPSSEDYLGLPAGKHIWIKAIIDGKEVRRSYSPVSTNSEKGYFDLVIKIYKNVGKMTTYLDSLKIGDSVDVLGPKGTFTYQKNKYRRIGMLAGGSGITPMLRIIREIFEENEGDTTEVSLIFGNQTERDIILKEKIDEIAKKNPNFKVYHTLYNPPKEWIHGKGYITKEMIIGRIPGPNEENIKILLCGSPSMLKSLKSILREMGYKKEHITVF